MGKREKKRRKKQNGSPEDGEARTGQVWSWGWNQYGQLGHNHAQWGSSVHGPTLVHELGDVSIKEAACGHFHTVLLTTASTVMVMGRNDKSQCGPVVPGAVGPWILEPLQQIRVVAVAAGAFHTLAVTDARVVYSWGLNQDGQLGRETERQSDSCPGLVGEAGRTLEHVDGVDCGFSFSACVTQFQQLFVWGSDKEGQLGFGRPPEAESTLIPRREDIICYPQHLIAITEAKAIACGDHHMLLLTSEGVLTCGAASYGRLGRPVSHAEPNNILCLVDGLDGDGERAVVRMAAGGVTNAVVTANGSLYTWGGGVWGQMGNGLRGDIDNPTLVSGLSDVARVQVGQDHIAAMTKTGHLFLWGRGKWSASSREFEAMPVPVPLPGPLACEDAAFVLAAGGNHTIAATFRPECTSKSYKSVRCPWTTTAAGPGLEGGRATEQQMIIVQSRDVERKANRTGGLRIVAEAMDLDTRATVEGFQMSVVDKRDGTYVITYVASRPGLVRLQISMPEEGSLPTAPDAISGSPFTLRIDAGSIDPSFCKVALKVGGEMDIPPSGSGSKSLSAGIVTGVFVQGFDSEGNQARAGIDRFLARVRRANDTTVVLQALTLSRLPGNPTWFAGVWTPSQSGAMSVDVVARKVGQEVRVQGCPLLVDILPGSPDASKCQLIMPSAPVPFEGKQAQFSCSVALRDAAGNSLGCLHCEWRKAVLLRAADADIDTHVSESFRDGFLDLTIRVVLLGEGDHLPAQGIAFLSVVDKETGASIQKCPRRVVLQFRKPESSIPTRLRRAVTAVAAKPAEDPGFLQRTQSVGGSKVADQTGGQSNGMCHTGDHEEGASAALVPARGSGDATPIGLEPADRQPQPVLSQHVQVLPVSSTASVLVIDGGGAIDANRGSERGQSAAQTANPGLRQAFTNDLADSVCEAEASLTIGPQDEPGTEPRDRGSGEDASGASAPDAKVANECTVEPASDAKVANECSVEPALELGSGEHYHCHSPLDGQLSRSEGQVLQPEFELSESLPAAVRSVIREESGPSETEQQARSADNTDSREQSSGQACCIGVALECARNVSPGHAIGTDSGARSEDVGLRKDEEYDSTEVASQALGGGQLGTLDLQLSSVVHEAALSVSSARPLSNTSDSQSFPDHRPQPLREAEPSSILVPATPDGRSPIPHTGDYDKVLETTPSSVSLFTGVNGNAAGSPKDQKVVRLPALPDSIAPEADPGSVLTSRGRAHVITPARAIGGQRGQDSNTRLDAQSGHKIVPGPNKKSSSKPAREKAPPGQGSAKSAPKALPPLASPKNARRTAPTGFGLTMSVTDRTLDSSGLRTTEARNDRVKGNDGAAPERPRPTVSWFPQQQHGADRPRV